MESFRRGDGPVSGGEGSRGAQRGRAGANADGEVEYAKTTRDGDCHAIGQLEIRVGDGPFGNVRTKDRHFAKTIDGPRIDLERQGNRTAVLCGRAYLGLHNGVVIAVGMQRIPKSFDVLVRPPAKAGLCRRRRLQQLVGEADFTNLVADG